MQIFPQVDNISSADPMALRRRAVAARPREGLGEGFEAEATEVAAPAFEFADSRKVDGQGAVES